MSNPFSVAQNTSPVPLVRALLGEFPDKSHVSTTPETLPEAITPTASRAKSYLPSTPASTSTSPSQAFNEQLPQLSERDSIFATHYLLTDSAATTPRQYPTQRSKNDPQQDVLANFELPKPFSPQASQPSLLPHKTRSATSITSLASTTLLSDLEADFRVVSLPVSPNESYKTLGNVHGTSRRQPEKPGVGLLHSLSPSQSAVLSPPYLRIRSQGALGNKRMSETPEQSAGIIHAHSGVTDQSLDLRRDHAFTEKRKRSSSRDNVEKRIEATLANEEPVSNTRSRKASHYLLLFKENANSQEQKKAKDRSRETAGRKRETDLSAERSIAKGDNEKPKAIDGKEHLPAQVSTRHDDAAFNRVEATKQLAEDRQPLRRLPLRTTSDSQKLSRATSGALTRLQPTDVDLTENILGADESIQWRSDDSPILALHPSLLEEIRNHHRRKSTFPAESSRAGGPTQCDKEIQTDFLPEKKDSELIDGREVFYDEEEAKAIDTGGDDDESEKEQISSAMYYPHQAPSPESPDISVNQDDTFETANSDQPQSRVKYLGTVTEEVQGSAEEVTIALKSQDESQCFHGDFPQLHKSSEIEDFGKPVETTASSASDTEYESWDDATHSTLGEDSGVTDDGDATPTAASKMLGRTARPKKRSAVPRNAVELKPYKHQVGGHSTVFRFSKRAVCKQLSNRENEFYEVVERRHPELLRFLPRYVVGFY